MEKGIKSCQRSSLHVKQKELSHNLLRPRRELPDKDLRAIQNLEMHLKRLLKKKAGLSEKKAEDTVDTFRLFVVPLVKGETKFRRDTRIRNQSFKNILSRTDKALLKSPKLRRFYKTAIRNQILFVGTEAEKTSTKRQSRAKNHALLIREEKLLSDGAKQMTDDQWLRDLNALREKRNSAHYDFWHPDIFFFIGNDAKQAFKTWNENPQGLVNEDEDKMAVSSKSKTKGEQEAILSFGQLYRKSSISGVAIDGLFLGISICAFVINRLLERHGHYRVISRFKEKYA